MILLIIAAILTFSVIRIQTFPVGTCPSYVTESVKGLEGRWYAIYKNANLVNWTCNYIDIMKLGNESFLITSNGDTTNGAYQANLPVNKEAGEKNSYIIYRPGGKSVYATLMFKIEDEFLFTLSCENLKDGKYYEDVSIHSRKRQFSDDIVKKFTDYLKKIGPQVWHFAEFSPEKCSTE
uniref:Venom protein n=1 Tax=Hemiscolopendra marginata TaxID=943146 RepID=A0A646QDU8_9MYRI